MRYILSGELSAGIAKMLHKCELTVRIEGPHMGSDKDETSLVCEKGIVTYYGCFQDPCREESRRICVCDSETHDLQYTYVYSTGS